MTTAARPTFEPARGGSGRGEKDLGALSKQYSSRDLPSHTKLKYRQSGQGTADEVKLKDFRRDLEERERATQAEKEGKRPVSSYPSSSSSRELSSKRPRTDHHSGAHLDADDPQVTASVREDSDDSSDDDSDEDDTAALMAELNRIKKERAQEEAKREAERRVQEEKIRMENILSGNPLLTSAKSGEFKVKRRWDDDVVFKNCAKGDEDRRNQRQSFINDTLRSEFHKKFMEKYIK